MYKTLTFILFTLSIYLGLRVMVVEYQLEDLQNKINHLKGK